MTQETLSRVLSKKVTNFISSRRFFYLVLTFFLFQASWLAVSASYPMLYDEYYHTGIIEAYSDQFSPVILDQTKDEVIAYRDITRNPSYFLHYLLSFPLRVVRFFTDSFYVQLVVLRLINVGFVLVGLIGFSKLLSRLGFKKWIVNLSLAAMMALPIFINLSAHVNYDNLLFLFVPYFFISALNILKNKVLKFEDIMLFVATGCAASITKYTFLPILLGTSVFVLLCKYFLDKKLTFERIHLNELKIRQILILLTTLLLLGLFTERFAINTLRYGSISPRCVELHEKEACLKQPILLRNELAKENYERNNPELLNLTEYTYFLWIPGMFNGLNFVAANIDAAHEFGATAPYLETGKSTKLFSSALLFFALIILILGIRDWGEVKKNRNFWLVASGFLVYFIAAWFYINYRSYMKLGSPFAIQPRYFLIFLPFIASAGVYLINKYTQRKTVKLFLLFLGFFLFSQGSGASLYLYRSNDRWFYENVYIQKVNNVSRRLLDYTIID